MNTKNQKPSVDKTATMEIGEASNFENKDRKRLREKIGRAVVKCEDILLKNVRSRYLTRKRNKDQHKITFVEEMERTIKEEPSLAFSGAEPQETLSNAKCEFHCNQEIVLSPHLPEKHQIMTEEVIIPDVVDDPVVNKMVANEMIVKNEMMIPDVDDAITKLIADDAIANEVVAGDVIIKDEFIVPDEVDDVDDAIAKDKFTHAEESRTTIKDKLFTISTAAKPRSNRVLLCAQCDFRCCKKPLLIAHLAEIHGITTHVWPEERFPCSVCGITYGTKRILDIHTARKHTNRYDYKCNSCSKKFKVRGDLMSHVQFFHQEKPMKCDMCGKVCKHRRSLLAHLRWNHKPKFECSYCKRRLVTQENLDQHIKTHHERIERDKIVCDECGQTFRQKYSLKRHMMVHMGCKPHTCIVCSKSFARKGQLHLHLLVHTGKRNFVCDICGKRLKQRAGLIQHRKTHPGNHPPLPDTPISDIVKEFIKGYPRRKSNVSDN